MSTRGQRFGLEMMPPSSSAAAGIVTGAMPGAFGPVVEVRSGSGKLLLGVILAGVGGFALHDVITGSGTFKAAAKDARRAKTVARRGLHRLAGKIE